MDSVDDDVVVDDDEKPEERNQNLDDNKDLKNQETPRHKLKRWLKENFETNRAQFQEASSNLFFRNENKSDILDKYDIIITFTNGYGDDNVDGILNLINDLSKYLLMNYPEMITELRIHHKCEKALYLGTNTKLFFDKYISVDQIACNNSKNLSSEQSQCPNQSEDVMDDVDDSIKNCNEDGEHGKYFPYTKSLSSLQRQYILIHLLNETKFQPIVDDEETKFPYLEKYVAPGDYIIDKLFDKNIINQMFSLHQDDDLDCLKKVWVSVFFRRQPLDQICSYFGMRLAIYFAFIGHYTQCLIYPTLFGLFITLFPYLVDYIPKTIFPFWIVECDVEHTNCILLFLFIVFNIFWSSFWLSSWQRKCRTLTNEWRQLIPNIKHCHHKCVNVNGDGEEFDVYHLSQKIFKYCVTFPIIGFCLILTFTVMFKIFSFQTWWDVELIEKSNYPEWTGFFPKVTFAIILNIINYLYYLIVIWLNEKEKHYNYELKENQLILKLFLFQFLNSYLPLFYIAFYLNDVNKLKEQLAAHLITRQVLGNLNETLWPFLKESIRLAWLRSSNIATDETLCKGELESCMYAYQSTFDDYLELVIQYGYVMLFAPVFPMAALCAFLNNLIEIRSDAFKLCFVYQRPFDYNQSTTVGVWLNVLNFLGIISIMSNCALMAVTGHITCLFKSSSFIVHSNQIVIIISVLVEHILLLIKWFIIPVLFPTLSQ